MLLCLEVGGRGEPAEHLETAWNEKNQHGMSKVTLERAALMAPEAAPRLAGGTEGILP